MFHVSIFKPHKFEFQRVIDYLPIEIQYDLTYIETPVQIVDIKIKYLTVWK